MPRDKKPASRPTAAAGGTLIARPRVEDMPEPPIHPGEVLLEEFLNPLGLTQTAFAERLRIPLQRLNDLIRARRGVTPDTALRLARALGTSAELWLNLQKAWDLWQAAHGSAVDDIAGIEPLPRDRSGALRATA
jgi:addiction module HigA family antidote